MEVRDECALVSSALALLATKRNVFGLSSVI